MRSILAAACLLSYAVAAVGEETDDTVSATISGEQLEVEIAATPGDRKQGLMGRNRLGADRGMLFVWPEADHRAFWMKNTPLPLSIAFLDEKGRVLNIEQMAPLREDVHYRSRRPAQLALEVNQGWFEERGIERGDQIRLRIPADLLPWREDALVMGEP
ncbi:MAG: DUF192 domain-containing protein [Thiohalorhabdus sp.]|uniref:DUF192 domain-containing protein n=1 Tax=Thiohalorhabdus sp. TaxID=3094134 RepID=UPI00398018AB